MKSILIVGGAGYIGSHVALSFLKAGHAVTVFDNLSTGQRSNLFQEARFVHGDVQDRMLLGSTLAYGYDAVVHLAALKSVGESMEFPERYARQNITGTLNLLEAISRSTARIVIFSSSAAVYGMPESLPMDEKHSLQPINFYGFSKLEIERTLHWYDRLKGIRFASLRYFNAAGYDVDGRISGREPNPENLLPVIVETLCGMRESMQVFGNDFPTPDGTGVRDYIHVTDLATAHVQAFETILENRKSLTVNLGTGQGCSVMEIIKMAEKVTGKKVPYTIAPRRKGDAAELCAKADLAGRVLGWRPVFSDLKTLVESTWRVYKSFSASFLHTIR